MPKEFLKQQRAIQQLCLWVQLFDEESATSCDITNCSRHIQMEIRATVLSLQSYAPRLSRRGAFASADSGDAVVAPNASILGAESLPLDGTRAAPAAPCSLMPCRAPSSMFVRCVDLIVAGHLSTVAVRTRPHPETCLLSVFRSCELIAPFSRDSPQPWPATIAEVAGRSF